jgi:hypothetical protein
MVDLVAKGEYNDSCRDVVAKGGVRLRMGAMVAHKDRIQI